MHSESDFDIQDGVLLRYTGDDAVVEVPQGVIGVFSEAFREAEVEEVILPEGLMWIGKNTFSNCSTLRRLALPSSLSAIPDSLCLNCQALEEVVIPEGVRRVGIEAFRNTGLKRLWLPDSVRELDVNCFMGCMDLADVHLGNGLRFLNSSAFQDCISLTSITLPPSLVYLAGDAFRGCFLLESVKVNEGLREAEKNPFRDCSLLFEVEYPESLENMDEDLLENNSFVERIVLPGERVEFRKSFFSRGQVSEGLSVQAPRLLPSRVPEVYRKAVFRGFREMREEGRPLDADIVEAWEAWEAGALPEAPEEPFRIERGVLTGVAHPEGRVEVPDGVIGIAAGLFRKTDVREVLLPDSVQWLQSGVFQYCHRLESVRLPAGLRHIPRSLFENCRNLKSVTIPDGVTYIGRFAFRGCGITTLTLPASLKTIDVFAFEDCGQLTAVRFPEGLREIRMGAFGGCHNLLSVNLPDSLDFLESGSFQDCIRLRDVHLGSGLRELEDGTFGMCEELRSLTIPANMYAVNLDSSKPREKILPLRVEGSFMDIRFEGTPLSIVAPKVNPALFSKLFDKVYLLPLVRGFISVEGKGFRYAQEYENVLRARRRDVWADPDVMTWLIRHNLLREEDRAPALAAMQETDRPDVVTELLNCFNERFPTPMPLEL